MAKTSFSNAATPHTVAAELNAVRRPNAVHLIVVGKSSTEKMFRVIQLTTIKPFMMQQKARAPEPVLMSQTKKKTTLDEIRPIESKSFLLILSMSPIVTMQPGMATMLIRNLF